MIAGQRGSRHDLPRRLTTVTCSRTSSRRRRSRWVLAALAIIAAASAFPSDARGDEALPAFARDVGLADVQQFVETVQSVRHDGRLPPRFIRKTQARSLGWAPGRNLCRVAPGRTIGGDVFLNAERRLPVKPGRTYREADLDSGCSSRGARRLILSSDGVQYVTVDHYRTLRKVP